MLLTTSRTLLEDWQLRRENLASGANAALYSYEQLQLRVLDFLIKRYAGSAVAAEPARFPLGGEVFLDPRAVLVLHHLGEGKVAGVKSRDEAAERATKLLGKISALEAQKSIAPLPGIKSIVSQAAHGYVFFLKLTALIAVVLIFGDLFIFGAIANTATRVYGVIAVFAITLFPFILFASVIRNLRIAALLVGAALMLLVITGIVFPHNLIITALVYCLLFIGIAGIKARFGKQSGRPVPEPSLDDIRAALGSPDPQARMEAALRLRQRGTLQDIGLISDLLKLPPAPDASPGEREALVEAMEAIAQRNQC